MHSSSLPPVRFLNLKILKSYDSHFKSSCLVSSDIFCIQKISLRVKLLPSPFIVFCPFAVILLLSSGSFTDRRLKRGCSENYLYQPNTLLDSSFSIILFQYVAYSLKITESQKLSVITSDYNVDMHFFITAFQGQLG